MIAKPISACAALVFRRSVSVAKALSGFAALIRHTNVPVLIPDEELASIPESARTAQPKAARQVSDLELRVKGISSLAEREIARILPDWSVSVDFLELPQPRLCEFVLWAEPPQHWSNYSRGADGNLVQGPPKQVWGARLSCNVCEFHMSSYSHQRFDAHVVGKLSEFARDILRETPAPTEIRSPDPCCRVS